MASKMNNSLIKQDNNPSISKFKEFIIINSISRALLSGKPLPAEWGFPSFTLAMPSVMESLFGSSAYIIYNNMNKEDQQLCRNWYEYHGKEASELYGGELWEEWNDSTPGTKDMQYFYKNYPVIYKQVVRDIIITTYASSKSKNNIETLITNYSEHPKEFEKELDKIVKF